MEAAAKPRPSAASAAAPVRPPYRVSRGSVELVCTEGRPPTIGDLIQLIRDQLALGVPQTAEITELRCTWGRADATWPHRITMQWRLPDAP